MAPRPIPQTMVAPPQQRVARQAPVTQQVPQVRVVVLFLGVMVGAYLAFLTGAHSARADPGLLLDA